MQKGLRVISEELKYERLSRLLTEDKWVVLPTGCWQWTRFTNRYGYGTVSTRINNKPVHQSASRAVLAKKLGRPLEHGKIACHTCDNRGCVNPEHLYEGTPKQNTADMIRRNRRNDSHILGGLATRKMSLEQVEEIRRRSSQGEYSADLAREFGVSFQTISNAVTGRLYGFNNVDARGENAEKWKHRAPRNLTDDQVREIRTRYAQGERQAALESEYGLGGGTVSRIVNGKLYADVPD